MALIFAAWKHAGVAAVGFVSESPFDVCLQIC